MSKQVLLLSLLLCSVATIGCFAQEPNVPTTELKIAGLKEKVTIRRDERGIAYVEAANEADLYFAQGFVTAQDRLWQMDLLRRVARGELSEIFGRQPYPGGTVVDEDKRWRKYGFARVAEQTLPLVAPETRAALENYARGVNAYIATLDQNTVPPEFRILQYRPREWQPSDSIIVGKILADGLSSSWRFDLVKASLQSLPADKLAQLYNSSSPHDVLLVGKDVSATEDTERTKRKTKAKKGLVSKNNSSVFSVSSVAKLLAEEKIRQQSLERVGLYAEDLAASNNWVVSGKRTADGKPLLANDPHLPASVPSIWYLIHLSAPNTKAAGVTFPGVPGVVLGHNENIAWGATNVGPDVQDLYLETFDPSNPRRYQTPSGWQEAEVRREEIKVRKSPLSTETESEFVEVTTTRNGVIFFEDAGKRYSLKWTAFDPKNNELEAFFYLNKAKNWNEFRAALQKYGGPMQNFVYADTAGNIGWYAAGRVPLRKTGDGSLPYDGAKTDGDWTANIPFEELPNLYNPPEGFIVTANQRIVGKSYKYQEIVRDFASPFRARRIHDLLSGNPKVTANDFNDFQRDTFDIALSRFARETVNQKAASEETLKLFGGWDGRMNADTRAALLADEMQNAFSKRIFDANLTAAQRSQFRFFNLTGFLDWIITEKPANWLPKEFKTYGDLLRQAEKDARTTLNGRFGADSSKWTWGEAYKIRFQHPLASAPIVGSVFAIDVLPRNGSSDTPNVGSAVSMRMIAAPADWDKTRHGINVGNSGLPSSPHYKDQIESWYKGTTPVFPFSTLSVRAAVKQKTILSP